MARFATRPELALSPAMNDDYVSLDAALEPAECMTSSIQIMSDNWSELVKIGPRTVEIRSPHALRLNCTFPKRIGSDLIINRTRVGK